MRPHLPGRDVPAQNVLFGGDGFGCAVVDRLQASGNLPDSVCVLDAGTGSRKLLFTLCLSPTRPRRLLVLDAVDAGRTPGELFEIRILACQTKPLPDEVRLGLSRAVEAALDPAVAWVLREYLGAGASRAGRPPGGSAN